SLDKAQPSFNSWVGTSVGIFAEGRPADFDFFVCKDGFSVLPAAGYHNYFGIETKNLDAEKAVTNTSSKGGWFMLSGVDFGTGKKMATAVKIVASSTRAGKVEIWLDDLKKGNLLATVPLSATGGANSWKEFEQKIKSLSGQHDVFIKFPPGEQESLYIKAICLSGAR
ncbi:MAG: carbohydrate-binding protein, partial [Bacteroidetes bacterium]|nr:carbohydrate-binding protein [Bacteroidota bacterium]